VPDFLEGATCITDVLASNGYTCGLSGKWHLGGHMAPQHGMSHWFCHPHGGGRYNDQEMIRDGEVVRCPGYVTDVITDDALGFLDAHRDGPFYLGVHYTAPHSPWTGHPQAIVDSYEDCAFKSCPQEAMHPWARGMSRNCLGNREMLKGYFAAVTAMDANVGRILDQVDALGIADDTLVVFMSDNGFSCGHHGFWGKGNGTYPMNMYENSVKVPALFRHPGRIAAGKTAGAMVSQYDVMPTLLAHLGLPPVEDPGLPGASFVPVLEGRTDEAREDVVVYDEYGPVRMIRTREWKYVHRYPDGPHELYDLVKDPGERENLAGEKEKRAVTEELRGRLVRWFDRYTAPGRDGARFPVTGCGQVARIEPSRRGEEAFHHRDY
jgi:arylsulfatase A-like enzyme